MPVELSEQEQAKRAEAMGAYRSQFAMLEGGALRRLTRSMLLRFELIWIRGSRAATPVSPTR